MGKHIQTYRHSRSQYPWQNDYIFVTKGLEDIVKKCYIVDNPEVPKLSDHNPGKRNSCEFMDNDFIMLNKYKGCLLGLAVGDALGAAVEFMSWTNIKNKYGNGGIQDILFYEVDMGNVYFCSDVNISCSKMDI